MGIRFSEKVEQLPSLPDGKWRIDCDECDGGRISASTKWPDLKTCPACQNEKFVLVDAIDPIPACNVADHTWEIGIEEGTCSLTCVDPHSHLEREAMYHHDRGAYPGCVDYDMVELLTGSFKAKLAWKSQRYFEGDCDSWVEFEVVPDGE